MWRWRRCEIHPNQASTWKRRAVESLVEVFATAGSKRDAGREATIRDPCAKIGELTAEWDIFLLSARFGLPGGTGFAG